LAGICRSRTDPRRRRVTGSAASSASIIDRICATRRWQWLGVFVREPDGDIAAGLAGSTYGDWLFIHDLWVRADLRRRGIGQELLRLAEGRARERGCHSAWLDTDDWADGDRRRGGVKRMQAFARNCRNQSL
jgi:GNAT superfamily N-acetyltransferase